LSSADAQPWWLAVAAANLQSEQLDHSTVKLVGVQPSEAVKLHQGTWHAGPFFLAATALFYNLELSDTNLTDHNSKSLKKKLQLNLKGE
jgi:ureidoglycolate hydrolase